MKTITFLLIPLFLISSGCSNLSTKSAVIENKYINKSIDSINVRFPIEKELLKENSDGTKTYKLIIGRRGYGIHTPAKELKDFEGKAYIEIGCVLEVKTDNKDIITHMRILESTLGYEQFSRCYEVFDFDDSGKPIDREAEAKERNKNPFTGIDLKPRD